MLEAAIAQAQGKTDLALVKTAEAAKLYDATPFDFGPPVPLKPPHEMAGEILLAAGRPTEALGEFDLALKWAPLRAASLLGRARALAASGSPDADAEYKLLDGQWRDADPARRAQLLQTSH
jgi:predicted Zn-dependent protease